MVYQLCSRFGCMHGFVWFFILLLLAGCEMTAPAHQATDLSHAVSEQWADWRTDQDDPIGPDNRLPSSHAVSPSLPIPSPNDPLALVLDVNAVDAPIESSVCISNKS